MDKQVHLSYRQSGAGGGEQKSRKRDSAGARTPKCRPGWMPSSRAQGCPMRWGLQNVQNVPPRRGCRPSAPGPGSSFTPALGHFLALGEVTPEMFYHPAPLCSPNARPHHRGFLCILCFICQLGTLGAFAMPEWEGW